MIDPSQPFGFSRSSNGEACLGGVPLRQILSDAEAITPAYVYDLGAIRTRLASIEAALGAQPHLLAYAVKANSAGAIVRAVRDAGAGIDAVSGGELLLARRAGISADKIVLSGVAKRDDEILLALQEGIFALQVESPREVERILALAERQRTKARISLRINPAVEADTHSHIATGHAKAKFGIPHTEIQAVAERLLEHTWGSLVGLSTHVGSMLREPQSYLDSAQVVCREAKAALERGHRLEYVDFGGGFGIDYGDAPATEPSEFARAAVELLAREGLARLKLVIEPGRSIVGPFGVLVAAVIQAKKSGPRNWVMIDAGMNDLLRPALYGAKHRIEPLEHLPGAEKHQVAGPVCESSDDFGEFSLGAVPKAVVIRDAGAYGFAMGSEYNGRPLPHEIFVEGGRVVHISRSLGVEQWVEGRLR